MFVFVIMYLDITTIHHLCDAISHGVEIAPLFRSAAAAGLRAVGHWHNPALPSAERVKSTISSWYSCCWRSKGLRQHRYCDDIGGKKFLVGYQSYFDAMDSNACVRNLEEYCSASNNSLSLDILREKISQILQPNLAGFYFLHELCLNENVTLEMVDLVLRSTPMLHILIPTVIIVLFTIWKVSTIMRRK